MIQKSRNAHDCCWSMHFLEMAMTCLTTEMIMNYLCGDEWMFSAILHTLVHSSFSMGRMSYGSLFYLFKGCTYQKYDLCGASDRSKKAVSVTCGEACVV